MAQFDQFIKIDSIPGESTDAKHVGEIEVLSYSFGMQHGEGGASSTGGARTGGRISHKPFVFTKLIDKASAKLMEKACDGSHIPKAVFQAHRATGEKQKYLQIDFENLVVSRFESKLPDESERQIESRTGAGEMLQIEEVALNYGSIKFTYTETDHDTGKPKGDVVAGWSLTKNTKI